MSDLPSRAAARSEKRFLMLVSGLMRSILNPMALAGKCHAAGLRNAHPQRRHRDRSHHQPHRAHDGQRQTADGNQRRLRPWTAPSAARFPDPESRTERRARPRHACSDAMPSAITPASSAGRRCQLAAVQHVALAAGLLAAGAELPVLCALRASAQPLAAVAAAISRSAMSSKLAKRASMKRGHSASEPVRSDKAGQGLERHGQRHHRQLRD